MENQVFESANLFEVSKQSFVTVGGITKNCLRLLPKNQKKNISDIVFGDCRGIIYSITYLSDEPKITIKTDPYPKEVNDVELDPNIQRIYFHISIGSYGDKLTIIVIIYIIYSYINNIKLLFLFFRFEN